MKLITTSKELGNEFRRLIKLYDNFNWATAWAGSGSKLYNDLLINKLKIEKIVVGIHFYQTHPDFIEAFLNDKRVRFIQQPEGTFHPKIYLFTDDTDKWELLIGSANFTTEAFSRNTEASMLVTNEDNNSTEIFNNAKNLVAQSFSEGKTFDKTDLENYRTAWKIQMQKIKSLSGQYGSKTRKPKPIHEVPIMNKSWKQFMKEVKNDPLHSLDRRLRVIEIAKELFEKVGHFNELADDERKFVAGLPNKLDIDGADDWAFFGSMQGAGKFKNKINLNDKNISKALDQIPLSGQITKNHYENFIKYFSKTFSGNYIATSTRLLCMKRPDTFVCFDSKNCTALCKDFGIVQAEMDYSRYWDDIVERIYDSDWWQNSSFGNKTEEKINEARAALLDSLYYEQ